MEYHDADFARAFDILKGHVGGRYGVAVIEYCPRGTETFHGFSDDRIADFEPSQEAEGGRSIKLRGDIPVEFKLFSLLHLFGHIIQFNQSVHDAKLALSTAAVKAVGEEQLVAIRDYELRASRYGAALLLESGLAAFMHWFTDLWAADWRFLRDVYVGNISDVPDQYADIVTLLADRKERYYVETDGTDLLEPLALPDKIVDSARLDSGAGFRIL